MKDAKQNGLSEFQTLSVPHLNFVDSIIISSSRYACFLFTISFLCIFQFHSLMALQISVFLCLWVSFFSLEKHAFGQDNVAAPHAHLADQVFSVQEFGAKGDGSYDNQVNLNSWVDLILLKRWRLSFVFSVWEKKNCRHLKRHGIRLVLPKQPLCFWCLMANTD